MEQEVWIAEECTVTLYEISSAGIIDIAHPVLQTTAHDVRVTEVRKVTSFLEPGCAYEQRKSIVIGKEIAVGRLCYQKSVQITPLQDKTKTWRVLIQAVNKEYVGTSRENDQRDFRYAIPISGPEMEWSSDSGALETPVTFFAPWEA